MACSVTPAGTPPSSRWALQVVPRYIQTARVHHVAEFLDDVIHPALHHHVSGGRRQARPAPRGHAASVRAGFLSGESPGDFPAEHYERVWPNRFLAEELNDIGRRGLGLT